MKVSAAAPARLADQATGSIYDRNLFEEKGGINMIHTTAAKTAAYKAQCVQSHLVSYGRTRSCNERRENIDDARYAICTAKMLIRTNANPKKLFRRIHAGVLSASKIDGN